MTKGGKSCRRPTYRLFVRAFLDSGCSLADRVSSRLGVGRTARDVIGLSIKGASSSGMRAPGREFEVAVTPRPYAFNDWQ